MIYIPDGATIEIFNKIKEGYNIKNIYYYYWKDTKIAPLYT